MDLTVHNQFAKVLSTDILFYTNTISQQYFLCYKIHFNPLRTIVPYMHHGKMEFNAYEQIVIASSSLA